MLLGIILCSSLLAQSEKKCNYCGKPISGKYLIVEGKVFHPEHFLCTKCGNPISGSFTTVNGKYYHTNCYTEAAGLVCSYCGKNLKDEYVLRDGKKYHKDCYENFILSKCAVCNLPLSGQYTIDMYGNKYHTSHISEMPKCDCCDRIISSKLTNGGKEYPDGRHICSICYSTALFDARDFETALQTVAQKLNSMGLKLDLNKIKISGVDRNSLREIAPEYTSNMQGYCYSETKSEYSNNIMTRKFTNHIIYVLTGLSAAAFESVIAHELMHVWLYDYTKNEHTDRIREGACNYISYLYLNSMLVKSAADFIRKLEANPDPVYGGGLREIKNRFQGKSLS
ncbi:MAG: hypothetical protein C0412_04245, partial [Flavobacterium sp.]|nr:hypothetical protein [Flavobacterium sp.]